MRHWKRSILYVIYKDGKDYYAIRRVDLRSTYKYYSDKHHYSFAPEELYVDGIPIKIEKNGMIKFDYEQKKPIRLKTLIPTWMTIGK